MARCATCTNTILFGGKTVDGRRYCNAKCVENGHVLDLAERVMRANEQVTDGEVLQAATARHGGPCPRCGGDGPVDVHTSHRVWSMVFLTRWQAHGHICCRRCGLKAQGKDMAISAVAGWWGFPWGLVMTPVQIVRGAICMASPNEPNHPSAELIDRVRTELATRRAFQAEPSPT